MKRIGFEENIYQSLDKLFDKTVDTLWILREENSLESYQSLYQATIEDKNTIYKEYIKKLKSYYQESHPEIFDTEVQPNFVPKTYERVPTLYEEE